MSTHTAISTLEELGLAKNEAILYDALLKTTDATIRTLLKTTPFSRTLLYYLLGNLEGYGLITSDKKGSKTQYNAEPPEKLADMIGDREKEFAKQKNLLKNVMGDLYSTYRLAHNKPGVKFFEGIEGLKEIYLDTLNFPNTKLYALLSTDTVTPELRNWLDNTYAPQRSKKNIFASVIASKSNLAENYHSHDAEFKRQTILMPAENFPIDVEINIYGETRVAFISYSAKECVGTMIESKAIYASMKSFFQLAWNQAKISGTT